MAPLPHIARLITSHLPQISPQDLWQRMPSLHLQPRQSNIIPTTYGAINKGPSPGEVAGIVLGSVGGFLFIFWLIYTYANLSGAGEGSAYTESVVVREARRAGSSSQRSRRRSVRAETVEVRRERTPVRVVREVPVERVVVEEEVRRVRREPSVADSAEVVVIEEHSPPRRPKSKRERERRGSRVVEEERFEERESGFRTVDPLTYGGVVGGRRSSSRR